jgi:hypothetical protein
MVNVPIIRFEQIKASAVETVRVDTSSWRCSSVCIVQVEPKIE